MRNFISKPIIIALLALLVAWFGYSEYLTWQRNQVVSSHIQELERQAQDLAVKNIDLEKQLKEVGTLSWQERTARTQLGLKREGEQVFVVSTDPAAEGARLENAALEQSWYNNFSKWWTYVFERPYQKDS